MTNNIIFPKILKATEMAVVGGVITATVLALYFVPIFFIVVLKLFKVKPHPINKNATAPQAVTANKTEE